MPPQPNSPSSVCGASTSTRCQASIIADAYHVVARRAQPDAELSRGSVARAMAHLAAVLGRSASPLVLVAASRGALARRARACIALAEVAARRRRGPSGSRPTRAALGVVGLVVLRRSRRPRSSRRPELVPLALVLAARRSGCRSTSAPRTASSSALAARRRSSAACCRSTVVLAAAAARARVAARARAERRCRRSRARSRCPLGGVPRRSRRSRCSGRTADAPAQNLLAVLPAPVRRARRRRRARAVPAPGCRARSAIAAVALAALFAVVGLVEEATHRLHLLHARPSRSGTRTRASSASPRSSATRACTGATSCSGSRSCSSRCLVPRQLGLALAAIVVGCCSPGSSSRTRSRASSRCSPSPSSSRVVAGDRAVARSSRPRPPCSSLAGGGAFVADKVADASTQKATSDRSRRIELTAQGVRAPPARRRRPRLAAAREPGGSPRNGGPPTLFVSHTTPLTVAAELGVVGLALYACAARRRRRRRSLRVLPARTGRSGSRSAPVFARALRALALLQRLLRGPDHVARARRSPRASSRAAPAAGERA